MAISQAQPLLPPLLVSLLFLPAALGIRFQTCKCKYQLITEIPNGATVELRLTIPTMIPVTKKNYSLCDIVACPPGPIVFTLSNVFTEEELLLYGISSFNKHHRGSPERANDVRVVHLSVWSYISA
ncbi:hypothetical protein YC2023_038903 [Brassica napus]